MLKGEITMTLFKSLLAVASAAALLVATTGSALAGPAGTWKRPNGSTAKVWMCGGGLCGKVTKGKGAGTTMFNGIKKSGKAWKGNMKHPDMPSWMTFNGTVAGGGKTLRVKGCMIGGAMCDAETWQRIK
jgi:uncharacterized protein (DUF2147 family)